MIRLDILLIASFYAVAYVVGEPPKFRILAPEFVCPKDQESVIEKPDNLIITLQTESSADLHVSWIVRWDPLPAPAQRLTLMLWKSVRALEEKLNGPQPQSFVYIIDNSELLSGVTYTFNVTASSSDGEKAFRSFHIDNVQGDQKLMMDGRSDMFSVLLVGGETTYSDMEFVLEAQVTTCHHTQDYFFTWSVHGLESGGDVNVNETVGSRLEIPAYTLKAGFSYQVTCEVYRNSNGEFIAQTNMPLQVLQRGLDVYLNMDFLIVSINTAFNIYSNIANHDFPDSSPSIREYWGVFFPVISLWIQTTALTQTSVAGINIVYKFKWQCTYEGEPCESFESLDNGTLTLPYGFPDAGKFEILLTASIFHQSVTTKCMVMAVETRLPVLQIDPMSRMLNENTTITLSANAANLAPTCSLTWYFATEDTLLLTSATNVSCDDCQHGDPLSESVTIYSMEESFLNELTDYSNETEWRQITARLKAAVGRARFVAQCGCSLTFNCDTEGMAYADISFMLNKSPRAGTLLVSPVTGTAMETLFRVSTQAVTDADRPLRYSFYCRLGQNDTLMLSSYLDHLAVETFLPYMPDGTEIWIEVCDSLGACSISGLNKIDLAPGEGRSADTLIEDMGAYVKRCEILQLKRLALSAIVTYTNVGQTELLAKFTTALLDVLPTRDEDHCIKNKREEYTSFLHWLDNTGMDIDSAKYFQSNKTKQNTS